MGALHLFIFTGFYSHFVSILVNKLNNKVWGDPKVFTVKLNLKAQQNMLSMRQYNIVSLSSL